MRCRQPKKSFSPLISRFSLRSRFSCVLIAGQDAVVLAASLAAVDTGLGEPAVQAAGMQAEALGHLRARWSNEHQGFRRFLLRRLEKLNGEWSL